MSNALFLSVRPKYAERIINGDKTVELRRMRPSISEGDRIVIYISSPTKEIRAISVVESISCDKPEKLWQKVKHRAGVTRHEYEDYFNGAKAGVAIYIREVRALSSPIALSSLRKIWPNFKPPQSYRYVSEEEVCEILQLVNCRG
ncbi:MAG: ASCH domain-containing protein [Desulfobaccales bacterium]